MKRIPSKPTTPVTPIPAPALTTVSGGDGTNPLNPTRDPSAGMPIGKRQL